MFPALRWLLPIVLAAIASWLEAADRPPNIVFLLADDLRADTIHALGNPRIRTPNLDRLVAEGTTFRRAITAYPICLQSRIEMMTGCTIFRGEQFKPNKPEGNEILPWAETLRLVYQTWHVGKWHNAATPWDWGYEHTRSLFVSGGGRFQGQATDWRDRPITGYKGYVFKREDGIAEPEKGVGLTGETTRHIADGAIEAIDASEGPFFVHVNFTAPHDPLLMPPGYEGKYRPEDMLVPPNFLAEHPFDHGNFKGRDEELFPWPRTENDVRRELAYYYAVIDDLDAQIGRILTALEIRGQLEHTVIIFSSDHGLAIGSHGLRGKQNMYEHTLEVPLVVRGPDIPRGKQIDAQVYLRDLYPTTCALADIDVPEFVEGKSLLPLLRDEASELYPFTVAYFRDVQRAIRTDRWKLIEYPRAQRVQFFDVVADPDELEDRSEEPTLAPTRAQLHKQLHAWLAEHGDPLERQ
ncbi:MAG TPA: sulfatase-like hydrolase/transferase [Pirellulales bacterium]|nr:sulfatase-like hydrolase/transferase [Pirellulales bacterium]